MISVRPGPLGRRAPFSGLPACLPAQVLASRSVWWDGSRPPALLLRMSDARRSNRLLPEDLLRWRAFLAKMSRD